MKRTSKGELLVRLDTDQTTAKGKMKPMKEIEQILDFMVEIEKLKSVLRKSRPVGLERYENSAEHSWHVCLSALMLEDYANEPIDINHVIKMLLIHDLGEIDADDKIVYSSETVEQKSGEEKGVSRLLEILPKGMGNEWLTFIIRDRDAIPLPHR